MQQNSVMAGNKKRYGTVSSLIQMPISGRFKTTNMALPTHMDAIKPQNNCGLLVITCGPGCMPLMVIAPTISAITALGGMPKVNIGMKEVCAPALFADSGPATPRMLPLPNGTSPGRPRDFFSTV